MSYNKSTPIAQPTKQGVSPEKAAIVATIENWFKENLNRVQSSCGGLPQAMKLRAAFINSISKTPDLLKATPSSLIKCLMNCAELQLFPGPLKEVYIVPFYNKGILEAQVIVGYIGECQLLYRTEKIRDIECEIIYEMDEFEYSRGSNRRLYYKPFEGPPSQRGRKIGVYCLIRNIWGGEHISYLSASEVETIKSRSQGAKSSFSPWNSKFESDVDWMWKKSAIKQNKLVPRSTTPLMSESDTGSDFEDTQGSIDTIAITPQPALDESEGQHTDMISETREAQAVEVKPQQSRETPNVA